MFLTSAVASTVADLHRVPVWAACRRRNVTPVECLCEGFEACHARPCSWAMTGARSAATRLARSTRALSALLGARWPKWRPGDMAAVCLWAVNSLETAAGSLI
jgi:hypothetical protein